jgi:glutathione-specific gamma-glutamylcyclotransferase
VSKIDRLFLQRDGVRKAVHAAGYGHLLLSDEALAQSLARTLAARIDDRPVWVFGYGSLVWNPTFHFSERRVARLRGYHRGFYLWSRINRGSPQVPGLVLGLDRGGSCAGIAYHLDAATLEEELGLIWRREMLLGTYMPRWVSVRSGTDQLRAITFVVDRSKPGYAGRLSDEQIVATVLKAHGHFGACADYLLHTAAGLEQHGIADRRLSRLAHLLQCCHGTAAQSRQTTTEEQGQ